MKAYIPSFLSSCLIIVFSFFLAEKLFSQADYKENQTDTTRLKPMPEGTTAVPSGITPGRAKSLVGVGLGLLSVLIAWRARFIAKRETGNPKAWAIAALSSGLLCILLSVLHLATTVGGFGTGGGKAGAIVALVLGIIGIFFSGMVLRTKKQ